MICGMVISIPDPDRYLSLKQKRNRAVEGPHPQERLISRRPAKGLIPRILALSAREHPSMRVSCCLFGEVTVRKEALEGGYLEASSPMPLKHY